MPARLSRPAGQGAMERPVSRGISALELALGAAIVIGHNVFRDA
ncbi:MAG TPA: hypothetical protein VLK83_04340 [Rhodanobacteraceae bacterium]|nr:hypothetical protein [Rhodanobacteraceae bacterium]